MTKEFLNMKVNWFAGIVACALTAPVTSMAVETRTTNVAPAGALEAHRLLVPGGRLALATWAARAATERARAISPRFGGSPHFVARTSGIHSIDVERVPMVFECDSVREYCQIFMDVALPPKAAALLSSMGDDFQKAVAITARPYVDGGRVRLVATTLRASGRR